MGEELIGKKMHYVFPILAGIALGIILGIALAVRMPRELTTARCAAV